MDNDQTSTAPTPDHEPSASKKKQRVWLAPRLVELGGGTTIGGKPDYTAEGFCGVSVGPS